MYLKSIEVQGFKSFAHKMKFDFHNGITGIVGPNGSGKSNVADAVRWVLGEQRVKQLRGGSMQDVIFSGTENRKPLSYASVAITLDNSDHALAIDYEEVTIARKLYRSGESEYLINGSVCRLKDVNELFYDTGIGKEGYSIIGQGQIDKILSGKPEDRRELFDEAAGIVKFKRRKQTSLKKLEEEQANLLRVKDILGELEKQVGPLERQSEKAREYLRKKEELKTYDINLFLVEHDRLTGLTEELETKIANTSAELQKENARYEEMKNQYALVEEQVEEIDDAIEEARNQKNKTTILKTQLENQISLLKEQIRSIRMNDEHYSQREAVIEAELKEREQKLLELAEEQAEVHNELEEKKSLHESAMADLIAVQSKIAELSAQMEQTQSDMMELLTNRASTKAKIQKYDTMLEQIQVRKAQLNKRLIEAESEASTLKGLLADYTEELRAASETVIALTNENEDYEGRIERLQEELKKKTEQFQIGQSAYLRESSRLESLKNITERYDGYGNSIRRVMDLKEKEAGLLGVVADIIKVDKNYETAVETALGGSIQNIVTADDVTAKRMIGYLKKNRFGRATFLPLTNLKKNHAGFRPEALGEDGVIGPADTLVQVEEKYRILAEHLLGRTLVVDHIDHATRIAAKYGQTIRMVTLEGELINPGGAISGGAFKNSSNLLGRRREIEEFEKLVGKLKEELDQSDRKIQELRGTRAAYYDKVEEIRDHLQKAYVIQNTARMNLDQTEVRLRAAGNLSEDIRHEAEDLDRQITDIVDNQSSITMELDTSETLEGDLNQQMEEAQFTLETLRTGESEKQMKAEEVHLQYAGLEQRHEFLVENVSRIREEKEKFEEERRELENSKSGSSRDIEEKQAQIQDHRQAITDSAELFAEIEAEIEAYKQKREELTQRNRDFLQERENLSKHISSLDKEQYRLESQKTGYEEADQKQIDYMWYEYEITLVRAAELRDPNLTNLSEMKKQIRVLKEDIKGLGSVNVNAIEEYKEVSERYTFLKKQHDDLVEAEETLKQIVEDLDTAMRKQFKEQFGQIAKEFDVVFKELFGGGKGTLELMETEDVLEAGIRIIAQPPGKKLQNMMQLSGGEKALTAIALLFAIQNLKPSPFCLLDEIEAALDDNNVVRFAKYLHKLTKNTQFIVITHRRGTMTRADRLYGITMQEKGVSALVSVSLIENQLSE